MKIKGNEIKYLLISSGLMGEEEIKKAEIGADREGIDLSEYLISKRLISERDLIATYAKHINIPYIDLRDQIIPKNILFNLPEKYAQKYSAVFFTKENGIYFLAMADPEDFQAVQFIEKQSGFRVKVFMATPTDISYMLDQYKEGLSSEISKAIEESEEQFQEFKEEIKDSTTKAEITEIVKEAPIAKTLNVLLEYAVKQKASDIHIEPRENGVTVRYRIDGILKETLNLPRAIQAALATRIKIISNLKIDEHRVPQDGRFKITIGNITMALRVSTLPVIYGEKIVIRLLDESSKPLSLEELGFKGKALETIKQNLNKSHGMILVTGPTGSGKSTTLYSILNILNTPGVNISTIEDPIEYRINGTNQTQVNSKIGMTFASGLRALLRQDPDIIMVGEIRDTETAEMGIHTSLTGHVVLSTLHTNSAILTLPRLIDMGIQPFLIASTLNVVIAQRLVRNICPHCKEAYSPSKAVLDNIHKQFKYKKEEIPQSQLAKTEHSHKRVLNAPSHDFLLRNSILDQIANDPTILNKKATEETPTEVAEKDKLETKTDDKITLYRGKGCNKCENGYCGRIGIYEVLEIDSEISEAIIAQKNAEEIEAMAVKKGMLTIQQDGFLKALEGITTIEEVLRVTNKE